MTYRIKITTFKNDRKEYKPYVKKFGLWFGLTYEGKEDLLYSFPSCYRDVALECIDKHNSGDNKKIKIDFEYIKM
jgi:hypothetical protein